MGGGGGEEREEGHGAYDTSSTFVNTTPASFSIRLSQKPWPRSLRVVRVDRDLSKIPRHVSRGSQFSSLH